MPATTRNEPLGRDQAVADLEARLAAARDRQAATAEILSAIANSPGDAEQSVRRIAEITERLFGASSVSVMIADGESWGLTIRVGAGSERINSAIPVAHVTIAPLFMPGAVYLENRQIHVPDIDDPAAIARWPGITPARAAGTRTLCGTPLRREGKAIGTLIVHRDRLAPFTADELDLLQSFADQAAIAAENARLFDEVQARTRELTEALRFQTATSDVLQVISKSPGALEPVFRAVLKNATRICDAGFGTVLRFDGTVFHFAADVGTPPALAEYMRRPGPFQRMPGGMIDRIQQTRSVQQTPDYAAEPMPGLAARLGGARSTVGVPILKDDVLIGAIVIYRQEVRPFTEREIDLVRSFAAQAAIAIENARLFKETQDRTAEVTEALERQTATAEVLRVISQSPTDVQPVFDAVVGTAVRLLRCDICFVLLRSGNTFSPMAGAGPQGPLPDLGPRNLPIDPDANFPSRAILGKTMLHLPDWSKIELPEHERQMRSIIGVNASLFLPLLHQDECIGLLALASKQANFFSAADIALSESFRDQALIAIQNTRLFNETREALERQTATADILKVIASSPSDVQPVFEAIAERSQRLVDALSTTVFRLVDGIMHLKAFTSVSPEADAALKALFPAPLADFSWGEAVASGGIHRVLDTENEVPGMRDLARLRGFRSMLFVPLLRDGTPIGLIAVTRVAPEPFPDHYVELLCTFADQAVIAIQNVQLFDEVQAKTRDLQESLQQQTATADVLKVISRSAFDLDTVMNTLTSSATRLCGADGCGLYLADGDKLVCRGMDDAGDADRSAFLRQTTIPIDETSGIGRALLHGVVTNIGDFENDPGARLRKFQQKLGFKAILIVPLMREGRAIGAFALVRNQVGMFTQRQVDLVQTFADQAVIAIENARLFDEVQARTRELSASLEELRTAQDRLVQTEKLASLGQLTAGIAHEIKNPLNFINNFAALSVELIDELLDVLKPAPLDAMIRGDVDELTHMLKGNLDKVAQHGRRADSIVKNMLLHSREGSGEHRPADINALVEESLNLAYHGARAERSGFNVTLRRDYAADAGAADLYPQEITRVLLNLMTNGFYATAKRKAESGDGFEPVLSAATKNLGDRVEIRIRDNGTGIPPEVREKIFNPFFTTKPAGEGTGLGLSMSHDIIVKQHGGTIDVETKPGAFTEFIVTLPRAAPAGP